MPELPEVEALTHFLSDKAEGRRIERADVASLSALKTFNPPVSALVDTEVVGCSRRGKFVCLETSGPWLVIHLARGGWVHWRDNLSAAKVKMGKGPLALRVALAPAGTSGFDVTEAGTEKRLALWVVSDPSEVEPITRLGPDPLSPDFDLGAVLAGRSGNLKGVLTDQSVIAGVGNAYSDEALHRARMSPFKNASKLSAQEVSQLHEALVGVLSEAVESSRGVAAGELKDSKRAGMAVHGRTGEKCPVCGDTVAQVAFASKSLQYCPTCQTGGRKLADRRMSRLLK